VSVPGRERPRIGVAKADFYPNVNLAAFFGLEVVALHGFDLFNSGKRDRRGRARDPLRTLETWIYAVILYIDHREVRVTTGDDGYDEFSGGRVRVCLKGKPN
jgi:hypothetical protein